ncbi:MAG: preprotein translocase subunit SecA [Methylotenera sp. RIFCSPLOWO2_02_FULL_45_14]|nr:MAG: preprotein translocase subunit SecA [Methylotenera sp. RIFCSPLOWO2_02_FULL_45_14]
MISTMFKKLFGSRNDRLVKQYAQKVQQINALEPAMQALSDDGLRAKTAEFKQRYANGETLDKLLPEAFAVVREGSKRALGMRHFDVQLIGGMVLNAGKIAEMRTGEGKTLVATLPAYLNALTGKGVHVITVNDYLAKRDAEWMGKLYNFLGLSIGINLSQMQHDAKQLAYAADITYGTNNEYGFDYLRDNMVYTREERVQRGLSYALIDEVDSILIDEARTPLIISGQADDSIALYSQINDVAAKLVAQTEEEGEGDFWVDEKAQNVVMSEQGHEHAEAILTETGLLAEGSSLYEASNITLVHHLYASLRARNLYHRDQHYVVRDGEIIIVDEFTGRMMAGRRWSDGLHQAVEAKEGVEIQKENQTLASITFQNYFRMYAKLSGMTGTADTEAYEFNQIYGLETVVIPTHRPMQRKDTMDKVYRTAREKYEAVILDIKDCQSRGQPVLVGTTSIENSELISTLLTEAKLEHQVLNAKQHEREAQIIVQAGRPGVITIATNMAGRGTDIVLGGNPEPEIAEIHADATLTDTQKEARIAEIKAEWQLRHNAVLAAGGLHIVGTERHESRRVDNQLRGRSGRQGDAGSSRFYLSLEDQLLRIFASDRVSAIMGKLNMPDGEAIEHPWVTRAIENAQRKVEGRNFDIRKQLLEYDDVANDQRKVIYEQRNELLEATDVGETITAMREDVLVTVIASHIPPDSVEELWDVPALERELKAEMGLEIPLQKMLEDNPDLHEETLRERILDAANQVYAAKEEQASAGILRQFERSVMLQSIDNHWREHLAALDHLRQGIHLRSYAQKNPKQEYKREAFELFEGLLNTVKSEVTKVTMLVQVKTEADVEAVEKPVEVENVQYQHADYDEALANPADDEVALLAGGQPVVREGVKVGRNDPCPCGSGKKYKQCHGVLS